MTVVPSIPYSRSIKFDFPLLPPPPDVEGFPTLEEIQSYEVMFTWDDLKDIIRTSTLGRLRRPPGLQKRYDAWTADVKERYGEGSTERYILAKRIRFASPTPVVNGHGQQYFSRTTDPGLYCLAANDWPYSTPRDVYHVLIWSQLPFIPPSQLTPKIEGDGVAGFTGMEGEDEGGQPGDVAFELRHFVSDRWKVVEWETAWFLNPPRLQSVKLLPHFHVFARRKPTKS